MIELPRRRNIVGTDVSITDYAEVLTVVERAIVEREKIFICCAPASTLMYARKDPALREALGAAAIVTPDGMGVVYAARMLGEKLKDRVYGPDLMAIVLDLAPSKSQSIWLHGGYDDAALIALEIQLRGKWPGLSIAGSYSPPHRPLTAEETAELALRINKDAPDIVWVGLGSPKQEIWMHKMHERLDAPVLCGVGAAFDFHAGRVGQAPRWMQNNGLEWLYRTLKEPARLGRRYLLTLPKFVLLVAKQRLTRST